MVFFGTLAKTADAKSMKNPCIDTGRNPTAIVSKAIALLLAGERIEAFPDARRIFDALEADSRIAKEGPDFNRAYSFKGLPILIYPLVD